MTNLMNILIFLMILLILSNSVCIVSKMILQSGISVFIKNINPGGLIIKNDLTFDELIFAFDKIINNESYYSQTVIKLVGQKSNRFL